MTRTKLSPADRRVVNAAAREVAKTVGRGKTAPAAPAKKKGGSGFARGLLRLVLVLGVLYAFFWHVMPSPWFAEPRNGVAVVVGIVSAVVLVGVGVALGKSSDAAMVVCAVLGLVIGVGAYRADFGSAAVQAGVMDCPKATHGTLRVESPSGMQCVSVPRCPRGKVPSWQAGGDEPTGKCVVKRAAR